MLFIVQIAGSIVPAKANINQDGLGTITYTLAYQRNSRQFAGTMSLNLYNNEYAVDHAPGTSQGDAINTDLYRVTATNVQVPVFNNTATNYTTIGVYGDGLANNTTHVNQTEDFIIPEGENAVWKLVGNMETRPSQLNATSLEETLGDTSDPLARLNERDTSALSFTAERGGDYRREKYAFLLPAASNYTTYGDLSVINNVYQDDDTLRTSDSDGCGLDYTLGGSDGQHEDDYYSMNFGIGCTTTAARVHLRRYSYLYSNNFAVTATIWFKVYAMD
nr:hypothetical protein [Candidatus Sigynarchaeota archaeon]